MAEGASAAVLYWGDLDRSDGRGGKVGIRNSKSEKSPNGGNGRKLKIRKDVKGVPADSSFAFSASIFVPISGFGLLIFASLPDRWPGADRRPDKIGDGRGAKAASGKSGV